MLLIEMLQLTKNEKNVDVLTLLNNLVSCYITVFFFHLLHVEMIAGKYYGGISTVGPFLHQPGSMMKVIFQTSVCLYM